MSFSERYLDETGRIVGEIDADAVERVAAGLGEVRDGGGRLFVLGVGGSAAHAGHAVNDFRKLCGFETYAPTDNVSELTARVNDDGWETAYVEWLKGSRARQRRRGARALGRRRQRRDEALRQSHCGNRLRPRSRCAHLRDRRA